MLVEAELSDDPALLRAMLVAAPARVSERDQQIVARDQEITTLRRVGTKADTKIERLTGIIAALQRHRFGARSEQLSDDQLSLAFEETEAALARVAAKLEFIAPDREPKRRNANRGRLPAHLERIEQVIDIPSTACSCCGGTLHVIGEDVAERLDVVPASFPGAGDASPALWLPRLRGRARPGPGTAAHRRGRAADRSAGRACAGR